MMLAAAPAWAAKDRFRRRLVTSLVARPAAAVESGQLLRLPQRSSTKIWSPRDDQGKIAPGCDVVERHLGHRDRIPRSATDITFHDGQKLTRDVAYSVAHHRPEAGQPAARPVNKITGAEATGRPPFG